MEVDEEALVRAGRLPAVVADLAALPWAELSVEVVESLLFTLESAQRTLTTAGYDGINALRAARPGRTRRLRDRLATLLHLSATEAGARIATAADLTGEQPALPETGAAARHGLIGPNTFGSSATPSPSCPTPRPKPSGPASTWS